MALWQRCLLAPLGWFQQYPPGILILAVVVYLTPLFLGSYWYFRAPPDFLTATTNFQKYLEATGDWHAIAWEQWDPDQDRYVVTASCSCAGQHRKARLSASTGSVTVSLYEPADLCLLGYHPKTITYQFEGPRGLQRVVSGQSSLSAASKSQQRLEMIADQMAAAFRKAVR